MSRRPRPCKVYPKWRLNWCPHKAAIRPPDAPSCEYGRKAMGNEITKEINRKRFGWKKRDPKPYEEKLEP